MRAFIKLISSFTFAVVIGFLAAGCASQPAASPDGTTLDQAIAEAAVRIDERIAPGSKIALLNFSSPSDRFSLYVLDELSANLLDSRLLTVVDRREVDLIRDEFDFQFSGEVGDDSIQAVGQMLGAQSIVTGSLTELGGDYRIAIRVLNVQTAAIEVHFRSDIANDRRVQALLEGGRAPVAARAAQRPPAAQVPAVVVQAPAPVVQAPAVPAAVVQPAPVAPVVVAPEPARLANGRRTFSPRPQAYQGARTVNTFVYYIAIRNEYMTITIMGAGPNFPVGFRSTSQVTLRCLDRPDMSFTPMQGSGIWSGGTFTFVGVNSARFSLSYPGGGGAPRIIFEEIRIGRPD